VAFEKNFGQGVAPDVAFADGRLIVVWGHQPLTFVAMNPFSGNETLRLTQPTAYFPKTDGRSVVYHDGSKFLKWTPGYTPAVIPGVPVGNTPTGISPSGVSVYQRNQDGQFSLGVYVEAVRRGDYRPTGIWECHDNGTFVMMDDARAPWAGGYVHTSGQVAVGEGANGGTLIHHLGRTHILYPGDDECRWPRVAVQDGRVAIVSWGTRGMRLWSGDFAEIAALPIENGAPPDPPTPTPPDGLEARILAVEDDLMRLREALSGWIMK
jgi:hypothetical protein